MRYPQLEYYFFFFFFTKDAFWKSNFRFFIIACRVPFFSSSLNNKNTHLFLYRHPSAMPGESGENWQDGCQWFTGDNQRGPQTGYTITSSLTPQLLYFLVLNKCLFSFQKIFFYVRNYIKFTIPFLLVFKIR